VSRSGARRSAVAGLAFAFAFGLVGFALPARAATIVVDSLADPTESGKTTLRDALASADDGDIITFDVTGTITLGGTELVIADSVTIQGPGADQLTIDGDSASTVLQLNSGKTATVSDLTITNGDAPSGYGSGIWKEGNLTLSRVELINNAATGFGGAIANMSGLLTIEDSTLAGNSAPHGGAIYSMSSQTMTIRGTTISANYTQWSVSGAITVNVSTAASFNISNSTISGSTGDGAGLAMHGVSSSGNPIDITGTLRNSTIADNAAVGVSMNAISNDSETAIVTLSVGSTIVAGNATDYSIFESGGEDAQTNLNSGGRNLTGDASGPAAAGDVISTDPLLEALANNGGPTQTHALGDGSPAIDKGENLSFSDYDQRGPGFTRFSDDPNVTNAGDGTDIGAFEVQHGEVVDGTAPTVGDVFVGFRAGRADNVPLLVEWNAADDQSDDADLFHEIQTRRRLPGGSFTAWSTRTTVTGEEQAPINIAFNRTVQFRVRSTDLAGNTSDWTSPVSFRAKLRASPTFSRSGPWTKVVTSSWGGKAHRGQTAATAVRGFDGKAVAVVMRAGSGQGTAKVCLDEGTLGETCVTVNLATFTPAGNRQLVVAFGNLVPGPHSISVEVVAGPVLLVGAIIGK
jgi:hypothetical protein